MSYVKIGAYSPPIPQFLEKNSRKLALKRESSVGLFADKIFLWSFFVSLILAVLETVLIFISWHNLPPQVPLFYVHPWGETRLASPLMLWGLPVITLAFIALNFVFAKSISRESKFLSQVLIIACLVIAVSSFYDVMKIITLLV